MFTHFCPYTRKEPWDRLNPGWRIEPGTPPNTKKDSQLFNHDVECRNNIKS
jgi:hypothetical protein